jgi:hypothetical protein
MESKFEAQPIPAKVKELVKPKSVETAYADSKIVESLCRSKCDVHLAGDDDPVSEDELIF